LVEFMLQWVDELDDWLRAAGVRLARLGRRLAGLLNDERSWPGDDDPYLAELARRSRQAAAAEAPPAAPAAGHGDPYLAEVTRPRRGG